MNPPPLTEGWRAAPALSGEWRVAIVGAGHNAAQHALGLADAPRGVHLACVVDPDESRGREFANRFGVRRRVPDVQSLVEAGGADVAIVSTPTDVRAEVCGPLFGSGIPVFLEKPMCERLGDALALVAAARRVGCPLAVNQNFRFFFPFAAARELIDAGWIGRPRHLVQRVLMRRDSDGWRARSDRLVMSVMTIHWLDGYRLLFGEPSRIYCRTVHSALVRGGGETATSLILEWPDGPVAALSESFSSLAGDAWDRLTCQVDGDAGGLTLHIDGRIIADRGKGATETLADRSVGKPRSNLLGLLKFLDSIEHGTVCPTDATDNLRTVALMEAAYVSASRGVPVCPAELLNDPSTAR